MYLPKSSLVAPSRGRGLKPPQAAQEQPAQSRPFTGAWIETECLTESITGLGVAPSRGRGLKHPGHHCIQIADNRRPFTGAWIETTGTPLTTRWPSGRPFTGAWIETSIASALIVSASGRPFTGAWIETRQPDIGTVNAAVAPSRGRGLKPRPTPKTTARPWSPLHGGVD